MYIHFEPFCKKESKFRRVNRFELAKITYLRSITKRADKYDEKEPNIKVEENLKHGLASTFT